MPFPFFIDLHKEQVRLIEILNSKVVEAEKIANNLLRESSSATPTQSQ